jgi:hypothetical protein
MNAEIVVETDLPVIAESVQIEKLVNSGVPGEPVILESMTEKVAETVPIDEALGGRSGDCIGSC